MKTPNTKHQTPNNLKPSNHKRGTHTRVSVEELYVGVSLVFGVWCLVF
jgi:hypothetical protein